MKRLKKHRIKREVPETSHARHEEHDLAYYIHDRVELMHQVFSVLKHKELRAMAPECVRHISIDDLQELCTEELLGISSKRLCAILDGADPPSNTESSSSSPERMETISLDSISSDEEILSQTSSKKAKKHKHRHKSKRKTEGDSTASRAGLTVLELLELQARARAIRAQLQRANPPTESESMEQVVQSSDDEVVIKEEAPEVVTISSDDEKPSVQELQKNLQPPTEKPSDNAKTVTKRINDLIITVPQSKPTRKIKLNRNKSVKSDETPASNSDITVEVNKDAKEAQKDKKSKKKQKKKEKNSNKAGSDQDEITLQLSDTEKMDLLEDLDRKNASSEDSESSSDSDVSSSSSDDEKSNTKDSPKVLGKQSPIQDIKDNSDNTIEKEMNLVISKEINVETNAINDVTVETDIDKDSNIRNESSSLGIDQNIPKLDEETVRDSEPMEVESDTKLYLNENTDKSEMKNGNSEIEKGDKDIEDGEITEQNKNLSDGEISQESLEKDTSNVQDKKTSEEKTSTDKNTSQDAQDIVCISDDDKKCKKKKKEKKKKSKKSDFRERADQNFYKQTDIDTDNKTNTDNIETLDITDETEERDKEVTDKKDDVLEYFELSDDSSCFEVEGVSVLSKEPTAQEIAALSAKIDEIDRSEVVTDEEIRQYEENQELPDISWKDRYLNSKKVKSVLSTANILNALRKKNIELKKKLEESKIESRVVEEEAKEEKATSDTVEGSIDHYNKLQGSTKFVDPVKDDKVSKEMEKDAKQLLKMYKKLLKYNDINKKKDPNKKKKKKQKKNKDKDKNKA